MRKEATLEELNKAVGSLTCGSMDAKEFGKILNDMLIQFSECYIALSENGLADTITVCSLHNPFYFVNDVRRRIEKAVNEK